MSEPVSTKEHFMPAELLYLGKTMVGEIACDNSACYIDTMCLDMEDVRKLRDWLNKVLP